MITVNLSDGRSVQIDTDDEDVAISAAQKFLKDNPLIPRGAELGEEDVSAVGDIVRGIGAGLVGTVEGISTLPVEAYEAISGSEEGSSKELRKFFAKYKPETSTGLGEAAKFITQFAVPGGLAAKAAKGLQMAKAGQLGAFAAADVAATTPDVETLGDFFEIGPTQRIETEDLAGAELAAATLANRLKVAAEGSAIILGVPALAKLGAAGLGKGVDALGKTEMTKAAAQAIKDPDTPFYNVGVKPDLENPAFFARNFDKLSKQARKYLTVQGEMPDRFSAVLNSIKVQEVSAHNNKVRQAVAELDDAMSFVNKNGGLFNSQDQSRMLNTINDYLFAEGSTRGPKPLSRETVQARAENELKEIDDIINKNMPKSLFGKKDLSLFNSAKKIRNEIDGLSTSVRGMIDDPLISNEIKNTLSETIEANKTYYGIRLYRAFKDTDYKPTTAQTTQAVEELVRSTQGLPPEKVLDATKAKVILNDMLQGRFTNANMTPNGVVDKDTLTGIAQGPLKGRRLDDLPAIRDFLGEYTGAKDVIGRVRPEIIRTRDLAEQELGLRTRMVETVDVLSKQIAKSSYFKNLVDYNNALAQQGKNRFLFDKLPEGPENVGQYSRIGADGLDPSAEVSVQAKQRFGPLAGKYVKNEYKAAFEDIPKYFNLADTFPLYATFLGVKGMSQIAKTVFSPVTQIRNGTTAGFFALANGNVGNVDSLVDSVATIFTNIGNKRVGFGKGKATKDDLDKYYNELIDLGVINTNSKIGEFESLLNDAVGATQYMPQVARKGFNYARNVQNTLAGKLYQGSDDVWKTYSYEMELGKLKNAFDVNPNASIAVSDPRNFNEFGAVFSKSQLNNLDDIKLTELFRKLDPKQNTLSFDDFNKLNKNQKINAVAESVLKKESAEIVKDTVPNYARVPEFIKKLRQMPFGNFVAFPAEIIRTSGNIMNRAVKELASESPEIRSIGMKRLVGSISVNAAIPATLYTGGLLLSGATDDQVQAYKRSAAYEWDRNSTLIPIATDKDGKITDLYNFSYTNPYDYLARPFKAVYNAVENGITSEKDLSEIAFDASFGESGAFYEYFAPFMDESIITEKMFDIARNKTSFGADIWLETDPLGLKMAKSFAHLSDGIMPGISPVDIKADVASPTYLDLTARGFPKAIGSVLGVDPTQTVGRQGYQIDPAQEFAEALTGVKSLKPRLDRVLYYRGLEAAREVRDAARIFNQVAKTRGSKSAEDITKAYITANEQRFKALRDLNMAVEDAKTLGLTTAEIFKPLKEAKTPNLNYLLAGRFNAFFPSSETIAFAIRSDEDKLANPFNMGDIGSAYADFQGRRFRPEAAAEQEVQPAPPPQPVQAPVDITPPEPTQQQPQSLFGTGTQALRDLELRKLLGVQ
jgi:hypothetical protein